MKTINQMSTDECQVEATDMLYHALKDAVNGTLKYSTCEAVIESIMIVCQKYAEGTDHDEDTDQT